MLGHAGAEPDKLIRDINKRAVGFPQDSLFYIACKPSRDDRARIFSLKSAALQGENSESCMLRVACCFVLLLWKIY